MNSTIFNLSMMKLCIVSWCVYVCVCAVHQEPNEVPQRDRFILVQASSDW